ncbi:MAG: transporter substrate-binding domain-containing protein [Desulforhopalus sp.]|nr:transporter substrate-binding domain-containing protein [Desulforhopalus sp.]
MTVPAKWFSLMICLLILSIPIKSGGGEVDDRSIRIGIFPFAPINFIDKDGSAKGINPDLLREIFRRENANLAFVPGSWAEGLQRLENEEIDLMMSVAYSDERAKVMDYGRESVLQLWGQVFVKPDSHSKNISDLFGRRIGIMRKDISGSNFITTIKGLGGNCEIIEFPSHSDVFQAVQNGEVDGGVAPQHFGLRHAQEHNLIGTSILFSPFSISFTSKKGQHRELLDHIDTYLSQWKKQQDSFYYETLNKWMAPTGKKALPAWLVPALIAISLAVAISICFIVLLNRAVHRKTRELLESEARFRDIAYSISDWIWEIDPAGVYTYCSEHTLSLLGYHPEEMIGKSCYAFIDEESLPDVQNRLQRAGLTLESYRNEELVAVHKNGTRINLLSSAVPIRSSSGKLLGFRGVDADITAQKLAEQERKMLERKLIQSQKMEAIGTLAGGIAHDFNNLLAAILGYAELAKELQDPQSETAVFLEEILRASVRARDLVKQILAFSRQAESTKITLQPSLLIKEAVKILRPSLPATIELRQNIEKSDITILADPTQLNQIVINLCTNAFHAMEEKGGVMEISLKSVVLTALDLIREPQIQPGTFVRLSVVDSGTGIAPELRDKIFDPYFTTKETGRGTGMGLAIVHGIVKESGGFISCYSESGQGTAMHVFLPEAADAMPTETGGKVDEASFPGGHERILFIDDEPMIAEMSKVLLESLGYQVMTLTDSTAALAVFRESPEKFDLVITDQTMPVLTGGELAEELLRIRPDVPIILCSGYSSTMTKEKAALMGIKEFALKPLVKQEIAALIRRVLDEVEYSHVARDQKN